MSTGQSEQSHFAQPLPDSMKDIFTLADYKAALGAQRMLHDLIPVVDRIESCGPECQEFRKTLVFWDERMQSLINTWMNPPPTA